MQEIEVNLDFTLILRFVLTVIKFNLLTNLFLQIIAHNTHKHACFKQAAGS